MKFSDNMKTRISFFPYLIAGFSLFIYSTSFAQDTTAAEEAPAAMPAEFVKATFEHGTMINNQTVEAPYKGMIDFVIHHRFGNILTSGGKFDSYNLFGLYNPSNIRLGINYGILDIVSLGLGATKGGKLYDLQGKVKILRQNTGGIPLSITYYGDMAYNATYPIETFWNQDSAYVKANRLSYYNEIMFARKFNDMFSAQLGFGYTHLNFVNRTDSAFKDLVHDNLTATFVGRVKFSPQGSFIVSYGHPLTTRTVKSIDAAGKETSEIFPKADIGTGVEISTGNHQFQIFVTSADAIMPQNIRVYNDNDFFDNGILIGFNITRQW